MSSSAKINPENKKIVSATSSSSLTASEKRRSNDEIDKESGDPSPVGPLFSNLDNSNSDFFKFFWKTFLVKFKAKTDILDIGDLDEHGSMFPIITFYMIIFFAVLGGNFYYSYSTGTGAKYLSPKDPLMADDPYCISQLKTITTTVSIDVNGNWQGVPAYNPGKVAYKVSTVGLQANYEEWDKMIDNFEADLARVTKLRADKYNEIGSANQALELLIPASYNFHEQMKTGFIDISVVGDANYLFDAQQHDSAIVKFTYSRNKTAGGAMHEDKVETMNSNLLQTNYNPGSGLMKITIPCRVDPNDSRRKIAFSNGDMECRDDTLTVSIDMRSASTALTVNNGLIKLDQLTKMDVKNSNYEGVYNGHRMYVDESYLGMDPILCKEADTTVAPTDVTICYVRLKMPQLRGVDTWALPIFNQEWGYGVGGGSNKERLKKYNNTCWYQHDKSSACYDNFRQFDAIYRKESIDTQLLIGFYFAFQTDYTFSRKIQRINLPAGYGPGWATQGNDGNDYWFPTMTDTINKMKANMLNIPNDVNLMDMAYFYPAMAATLEMAYVAKTNLDPRIGDGSTFADFVNNIADKNNLPTLPDLPFDIEDKAYMIRNHIELDKYINDPVYGFNKYYSDCTNLKYWDHWGLGGNLSNAMTSLYTAWVPGAPNSEIPGDCADSFEDVIRKTFKYQTKVDNNNAGNWPNDLDGHVIIATRMYYQDGFNLGKSSERDKGSVGKYQFPDAAKGLRNPPESLGDAFETCVDPPSAVALNAWGIASSNAAMFGDNVFFVLLTIVMFIFNERVIKNKAKTLVFPNDKNRFYGLATTLALRKIISQIPALAHDIEMKKVMRVVSLYRNDADDNEETYDLLLEDLALNGVYITKKQLKYDLDHHLQAGDIIDGEAFNAKDEPIPNSNSNSNNNGSKVQPKPTNDKSGDMEDFIDA